MRRTTGLLLTAMIVAPAVAAQDFDDVEIRVVDVAESIYMLVGSGGNIGMSVGEDGTFLVDDQYAPLTEKIVEAIATVTADPVDFVINTHWHFDHTDGNENFGGAGAVIVSHENSRRRMETDQLLELFDLEQEAYAREGLPKVTFDQSVRFHLNGQTIDVFHLGAAHTDGDAIVYFRNANVMHTGDVFVRYGLPFIDQPNGGSINGMIDVVDQLARLTDDETLFIPGHGDLARRSDLLEYLEMLVTIRDSVRAMIEEGMGLAEIVAAGPADGYPAGTVATGDFLRLVYDSLMEER